MEDAITDSVGRLLGAQRRREESNNGYTSQTSAGPWVGDTNRSISDVACVYLSPDEREAYVSKAVRSAAKASCSNCRRRCELTQGLRFTFRRRDNSLTQLLLLAAKGSGGTLSMRVPPRAPRPSGSPDECSEAGPHYDLNSQHYRWPGSDGPKKVRAG